MTCLVGCLIGLHGLWFWCLYKPARRPVEAPKRSAVWTEAMSELDAIDERSGLNWIISYVQGKMSEQAQPVESWVRSPQLPPESVTTHRIDGIMYRVYHPSNACYEQLPDGAGWRYAGTVEPLGLISIDEYFLARRRAANRKVMF